MPILSPLSTKIFQIKFLYTMWMLVQNNSILNLLCSQILSKEELAQFS